tara:strand:- start:3070 stop:3555 length:486 start_codon:yes stop_codon:yes gene_type:complete
MIVVNSSPLISFGKQGVLYILKDCFKKIIIPESVYNEIIKHKDCIESIALNKAINENWITIEKIQVNPALKTQQLGEGEKEAISLAVKHNIILIIDDDSAKTYASLLRIEAHGSLFVIYVACVKKLITKDKAKEILNGMILDGFYISTEVYSDFLDLLNSI